MITITANNERINNVESNLSIDYKAETQDAISELAAIIATAIYKAKKLDIADVVAAATQKMLEEYVSFPDHDMGLQ